MTISIILVHAKHLEKYFTHRLNCIFFADNELDYIRLENEIPVYFFLKNTCLILKKVVENILKCA